MTRAWKSRHGFVSDKRFSFEIKRMERRIEKYIGLMNQIFLKYQGILDNQRYYLKARMGKRRNP